MSAVASRRKRRKLKHYGAFGVSKRLPKKAVNGSRFPHEAESRYHGKELFIEIWIRMKDIKSMDLNLLKALDVLLDERNVTRAAARLGLTQPALSGMLRGCVKASATRCSRAQRGIVPTQRALDIGISVKQVLAEIDALLQPPSFDPATAQLTFSIAATDYALRAIAVPFLSALKQHAPRVRVSLVPVESGLLQNQLERGQIDLALLTPEITPPNLHARELFKEHYVCVLREDHPAAMGRKLTVKQFCARPCACFLRWWRFPRRHRRCARTVGQTTKRHTVGQELSDLARHPACQ
jgi:DNA-binding transcriptional LysR family regulator